MPIHTQSKFEKEVRLQTPLWLLPTEPTQDMDRVWMQLWLPLCNPWQEPWLWKRERLEGGVWINITSRPGVDRTTSTYLYSKPRGSMSTLINAEQPLFHTSWLCAARYHSKEFRDHLAYVKSFTHHVVEKVYCRDHVAINGNQSFFPSTQAQVLWCMKSSTVPTLQTPLIQAQPTFTKKRDGSI